MGMRDEGCVCMKDGDWDDIKQKQNAASVAMHQYTQQLVGLSLSFYCSFLRLVYALPRKLLRYSTCNLLCAPSLSWSFCQAYVIASPTKRARELLENRKAKPAVARSLAKQPVSCTQSRNVRKKTCPCRKMAEQARAHT